MLITAYCPECQSRYQLNADLRGRKMRCPNANCHAVFTVREATGGSPRNGARAADVRGDLNVPLTGAAPAPEFDWQSAPPPVQAAKLETRTPVAGVPSVAGSPPGSPKPASRERQRPERSRQKSARDWDEPSPAGKRRWMLVGAITLFVITLGAVGYGAMYLVQTFAQDEDARRADAEKDYQGGSYGRAATKYRELAKDYGGSPHGAEYALLADLGDIRDAVTRTPPDLAGALDLAEKFVKDHDARDPQLKAHRDDLSAALLALATSIADAAEAAAPTKDGEESVPKLVRLGSQALDLLRRFPPKDADQIADLQGRLDQAGATLARATERRRAVKDVLDLLPRDISGARRLAMLRQVADDATVRQAIDQAENNRLHSVTYQVLNTPPQADAPAAGPPAVLVDTAPRVRSQAAGGEVVLAVARGLLYALDGRDGRRLWACRVGLDAGDLPTRVPPRGDAAELVVVASADPPALTARDAHTGAVVWHQRLERPALGRPVRGDVGRLFVPTAGAEGFVYDLDARTGLFRGRFVTHQPLAAGGAYDPAAQRLYVPARGQGVYVFNYAPPSVAGLSEAGPGSQTPATADPKCDGLLPTGHAPGSLRGEPIVVSGEEGIDVPRYLVLGEADGVGAMTLNAFRLLDKPTEFKAAPPVRLPGWSWFPPYHDPETIALVTDAGAIGLFGIQQAGNERDPPLFPLLGDAVSAADRGAKPKPARAQLVHAEEYGFWVLADGVLKHWRLGLTRREGRKLVPAWGRGVSLGAPLHAAQVSADRGTLYLITQTDSPPACRATAVDARTGDVIWQRPLGVAPQGEPVAVGGAVVVLDQSGALYRFDPARHPADVADPWQAGGTEIARPVPDLVGTPYLLPAADGQSAWGVLVRPESGALRLTLRRVAADGTVTAGSVAVPAALGGPPALGPAAVVLPLANGQLCRVTLHADNPRREIGPDWRAPGTRPDARGQVVHWKDDEYLVGDGGRRLFRLTWPAGGNYKPDPQPLELTQRAIGLTRLPAGGVVVADAGGSVTLLTGDRPTPGRSWRVGPITAGPWAVGDRLAVVVNRRKLVWLNPDADQPVWTYAGDGDGIEAPPRLVDGKLIVADLAGRFTAVDAATGKPRGGYRIAAEAAPAAAVTPFGPGRLFAPLTDGTALLLGLRELEQ